MPSLPREGFCGLQGRLDIKNCGESIIPNILGVYDYLRL